MLRFLGLDCQWIENRVASASVNREPATGQASPLLNAICNAYRITGLRRGGGLIDLIPHRLLGRDVISANTDAGPLVLRIADRGCRQLLLYGHPLTELEETKIICALLPSARGILDIGASYGWYTKLATNLMAPRALKIALEANPEVAACLQNSLSGLSETRVFNVAATDRGRQVRFYCASTSVLSSAVRPVGTATNVEGLAIDVLWPIEQPLDFVKCDVEGGELNVLRGSRDVRKSHEPVWMLEFNERFLLEASIEPAEFADEVSDLLCWWRSDSDGWRQAENLGAIIGTSRIIKNIFLVPPRRATQFARLMEQVSTTGACREGAKVA
jgi:FkbM family methyltransferase